MRLRASSALVFASGAERLALLDADRLHVEALQRREDIRRLLVHQLREHLEERDGVGVDRVDRLARAVEELHLAAGVRRLRQRINLDLLHQRDGLVGLSVHLEAAQEVIDAVGRRLDDEVTLGHLARVTRRQEQILAALALVRPERADIHEPALQRIHRRPEHFRRRFHDGRAVRLQIEKAHAIHRLGVRREHQRLGVHERFPDDDLVGPLGAEVADAAPRFDDRDRRHLREIDLDRAVELELIEQRVGRRGRGIAVLELEVAEAGLDRLGADPAVRIGRLWAWACMSVQLKPIRRSE